MGLTVTSGPASTDLTTVEAVKLELEISSSDDDTLFEKLIDRASALIHRKTTGSADGLAEQTYEESVAGFNDPFLLVSRTPVTDVASVTLDGTTLDDVEIEDADAGLLYREKGFDSTERVRQHLVASKVPGAHPSITVTYTAGYVMPGEASATLPDDLEKAAIETVIAWHAADPKRDPALASKKVGDVSWSYRGEGDSGGGALPPSVREMIAPYVLET